MNDTLTGVVVVFDWNGTVMDDTDRARRATNAVLIRRGLPALTMEAFRATFRLPMQSFFAELGLYGDDHTAAVHEWNSHLTAHPACPRPSAVDSLTRLATHGATLGVVSAAGTATVHADARAASLDHLLHFIDGGITDKTRQLRARRNGALAIYVGDTAHDIQCGRTAGYRTVAITAGYTPTRTLHAAGPDHIIDTLTEITDLLTTK